MELIPLPHKLTNRKIVTSLHGLENHDHQNQMAQVAEVYNLVLKNVERWPVLVGSDMIFQHSSFEFR